MKLYIYVIMKLAFSGACKNLTLEEIDKSSTSAMLDSVAYVFLQNPMDIPNQYLLDNVYKISSHFYTINEYKPDEVKSRLSDTYKDDWSKSLFQNNEFSIYYSPRLKEKVILYKTASSSNNWNVIFHFVYYKKKWKFREIDFYYKDPARLY